MSLVKFTDKDHKYLVDGIQYTSASGLFKKFQEPFDRDNKTLMKATRPYLKKEVYDKVKKQARDRAKKFMKIVKDDNLLTKGQFEEVKKKAKEYADQWTQAGIEGSSFGTERHSEKEKIDVERGWSMNPYTEKKTLIPDHYYKMREKYSDLDNVSMADDLSEIPDGYYPEFLVHWHPWKTAGQADKAYIETVNGVRYLDLDDWKTDKKIKTKGFFNKNTGMQKLLYPLDHLPDCNRYIYEIKISFYAYMCEMHGLTPRNLGCTHLVYNKERTKEIGQKLYHLTYRRWECEQMIKDFLKK